MTQEEKYRHILSNHLPVEAVDWVFNYLNLHKIHFHITRERRSKLGDYRRPHPSTPTGRAGHPYHEISVNGDLNPYFFLWVFLHEAAHLETFLKHKYAQPHGHEWQEEYRQLLVTHIRFFPAEIHPLIGKYTRRIPLSHPIGKQIEELLHRYDPDYDPSSPTLHLDDLKPGDRFCLKNRPETTFQAEQHRRTRWLCRDLGTGRQYLVSGSAEVSPC